MKVSKRISWLVLGSAVVLLQSRPSGLAQTEAHDLVKEAARHDLSQPLSVLATIQILGFDETRIQRGTHFVRNLPLPPKTQKPLGPAQKRAQPRPIVRAALGPIGDVTQKIFLGEGIADDAKHEFVPPDTNGAVGTKQFVQWVNTTLAVFDKSGKLELGPLDGNKLWNQFGGKCELSNDGDPIVLFDKIAKRWVMTQFAFSGDPSNSYSQCIAVSQTEDATGPYYRYEFQFDQFNDYPKFGVWPDAYFASFNMFQDASRSAPFVGGMVCAFERKNMLAGLKARMRCFFFPESMGRFGFLPADLDGKTLPPLNSPNYFMNFLSSSALGVWKFQVDWSNPANSTFKGPVKIDVDDFAPPCPVGEGNNEIACIPQPPNGPVDQYLQSLADRLMYRLAYRNFGDHESLVVNHTVKATKGSGIRWYELRIHEGSYKLEQQGTLAPDSLFRWMGSIASDKKDNLLLGYSLSGPAKYPSIRYTGRNATDPPDAMAAEAVIADGTGSQLSEDGPNEGFSRWGDYASMSVDPIDDCTFWFTTEGLKETGKYKWHTYIAAIRFKGCMQAAPLRSK